MLRIRLHIILELQKKLLRAKMLLQDFLHTYDFKIKYTYNPLTKSPIIFGEPVKNMNRICI
jgi:hypothetical protein